MQGHPWGQLLWNLKKESGTQEVHAPLPSFAFPASVSPATWRMHQQLPVTCHRHDVTQPSNSLTIAKVQRHKQSTTALGMCACADGCADGNGPSQQTRLCHPHPLHPQQHPPSLPQQHQPRWTADWHPCLQPAQTPRTGTGRAWSQTGLTGQGRSRMTRLLKMSLTSSRSAWNPSGSAPQCRLSVWSLLQVMTGPFSYCRSCSDGWYSGSDLC